MVEELDPIIENYCRSLGLALVGKDVFPLEGGRVTDAAKSRINFSGRGQAMPSLRTGYVSPQTSFTYW